jgi:putative ABC transport system substrate-binding protein
MKIRSAICFAVTIAFWLSFVQAGSAHEIVAVLSSDLGPYKEAFEGFQEGFGQSVRSYNLSGDKFKVDADTRLVVAIGGKAALFPYPEHTNLIYCLAPGTDISAKERSGQSIAIRMLPAENSIVLKLKEIQPSMRKLAIFWISNSLEGRVEKMRQAAIASGVEIISEKLNKIEEIPDRLRSIYSVIDAIWLMPDPLLISSQSFNVLKEFSWSNKVPLYTPSSGLVEQGATASISTPFHEIGRLAGVAARQLLSGGVNQSEIYPEKLQVMFNMKAVSALGLKISESLLRKSDKVLP